MTEHYFELSFCEDGDSYFYKYTKQQLLKKIQEEQEDCENPEELDEYLEDMKTNHSYDGRAGDFKRVIIKGEIVVPKAKVRVKAFDLD